MLNVKILATRALYVLITSLQKQVNKPFITVRARLSAFELNLINEQALGGQMIGTDQASTPYDRLDYAMVDIYR